MDESFIRRAAVITELVYLRGLEKRRLIGIRWDDVQFRRETESRIRMCEARIRHLFSR